LSAAAVAEPADEVPDGEVSLVPLDAAAEEVELPVPLDAAAEEDEAPALLEGVGDAVVKTEIAGVVVTAEAASEAGAEETAAAAVCALADKELSVVSPITEIAALVTTEVPAAAADVVAEDTEVSTDVADEEPESPDDAEVVLLDEEPDIDPLLEVVFVFPSSLLLLLLDEEIDTVQLLTSSTSGRPLTVIGFRTITQVSVRGPVGVMALWTVFRVVGAESCAVAACDAACRFATGYALQRFNSKRASKQRAKNAGEIMVVVNLTLKGPEDERGARFLRFLDVEDNDVCVEMKEKKIGRGLLGKREVEEKRNSF